MKLVEIIAVGFVLGLISLMWTSLSGVPINTPLFTTQAAYTFGWLVVITVIARIFLGD